ncbi:MAG TPA: GAF domain-containing protein [Planctomycetes bacterium]|nr:GAF domain-containing protein [Planctomycetota bacterium]
MSLLPHKIHPLQTLAEGGQGEILLGASHPGGRLVVLRPLPEEGAVPIPRHPSLARKMGCVDLEGQLYEVEAFLEGTTLGEAGLLPSSTLIPIAHHCLRALGTLHLWGLVHGDVSPGNIILTSWKGETLPVLIDFGMTGPIGSPVRGSGTFGTMAPEAARGSYLAPSMDLHALGLSLLAAALGCAPDPRWTFEAAILQEALQAAPPELLPLLNALSAPNPRQRAASWSEAILSLPPLSENLPAPAEFWPLVGREELLHRAKSFLESPGRRVLVLTGGPGSGKRSLGRQIQYAATPGGWRNPQQIAFLSEDSLSGGNPSEQLGSLLAALERGETTKAILCARDPGLADLFEKGEGLLRMAVPPLNQEECAQLCALLPLGGDLDPIHLWEETEGVPGRIQERLDPDPFPTRALPLSLMAAFHFGFLDREELAGTPLAEQESQALTRGELVAVPGKGLGFRNPKTPRELRLRHSPREARIWHKRLANELSSGSQPAHLLVVHRAIAEGEGLEEALQTLQRPNIPIDLRCELFEELARCMEPALLCKEGEAIQRLWVNLGPGNPANPIPTWVEQLDPERLSPPLLSLRGRLLLDRGQLDEARKVLSALPRRGFEGWEESRIALSRTLQFQGRYDASDELARALLEESNSPRFQAEAGRILSLNAFRRGRTNEAVTLLKRALATLGKPRDERESDLQRGLLQNLGLFERKRGKLEEALRLFEQAAQEALLAGDIPSACIAWTNAGIALEDRGRLKASLEPRSKAYRRASALGLAQARDVALAGIGIALAQLGADGPAVAVLEEAAEALQEQGLGREALLARLYGLGARSRLDGLLEEETGDRTQEEAALRQRIMASGDAECMVLLWAFSPDLGKEKAIPLWALRACGKKAREQWKIARSTLHLDPSSRATEGERKKAWKRLKEIAKGGLPVHRVEAALALAQAAPPAQKRSWIAQALRGARRLDLPKHALVAHSLALGTRKPGMKPKPGRQPSQGLQCHAQRIQDLSHQLSTIPSPIPPESAVMMKWNQLLKALGKTGQDIAKRLGPSRRSLQAEAFDHMVQINRLIQKGEDSPESLVRGILRHALELTGAWRGLILEKGIFKKDRLLIPLSRAEDGSYQPTDFHFSKSILTEVLETGKAKLTFNALEDPELRQAFSVVQYDLHAIICVPLFSRGHVVGALYLDHPYAEGTFEEGMLPLLETLATQISISLESFEHQKEIEALNLQLQKKVEEQELEIHRVRREQGAAHEDRPVLYRTQNMEALMRDVRRVASSELPAHIRGETGTGKELIARRLHQLSPRRMGPFVAENCTSLSKELLESELFGHVAGSFTGATRDKKGLFEMANGGTLFLDEIGDMPLALQSKILRALQEGEIRPVGSTKTKRVDVRLITATHRDLEKLVQEGKFREDLFYRIVVADLAIPPLRERKEDIPLLAKHFLKMVGSENYHLPAETLKLLQEHDWPGNVRELESAIRSAQILAEGEIIRPQDLPERIRKTQPLPSQGELPALKIRDLERLALQEALKRAGGNRQKAANLLGISRSSVFVKIREFGIQS